MPIVRPAARLALARVDCSGDRRLHPHPERDHQAAAGAVGREVTVSRRSERMSDTPIHPTARASGTWNGATSARIAGTLATASKMAALRGMTPARADARPKSSHPIANVPTVTAAPIRIEPLGAVSRRAGA